MHDLSLLLGGLAVAVALLPASAAAQSPTTGSARIVVAGELRILDDPRTRILISPASVTLSVGRSNSGTRAVAISGYRPSDERRPFEGSGTASEAEGVTTGTTLTHDTLSLLVGNLDVTDGAIGAGARVVVAQFN